MISKENTGGCYRQTLRNVMAISSTSTSTRYADSMAYAKTIQKKEKEDTNDGDNGDEDDDDTNVDMNEID